MNNPQNWQAGGPPEYEHHQHERARRVPIYVPAPVADPQDPRREGKRISWPRVIGLMVFLLIAIPFIAKLVGALWSGLIPEGFALTQYLEPKDLRFLSLVLVGIGLGVVAGILVRLARKI